MKSYFLTVGFALLTTVMWSQKPVSSVFRLKWAADIGITTYRTNIVLQNGKVYIGSNGVSRNAEIDEKDGAYEIDAKTGVILRKFALPFAGDNDVTGVAIDNDRLYCGTDNFYFLCYDLKTGKELWKYALPYDVESTPVLADFNGDGSKDVAFAVENFGFYALDGKTGQLIWEQLLLNAHNGNVTSALVDCNEDGVLDLINTTRGIPALDEIDGFKMAHYGDYHVAINGKNGSLLWQIETGAGVHNSPFLYERNGQKRIALLDCYGDFFTADTKGNILSKNNFGYGWFSSPVMTKDDHLILGSYSVEFNDALIRTHEESTYPYLSNEAKDSVMSLKGTVSATSVVADILGKGYMQVAGQSESGELFIMKTDGSPLQLLKLPSGGEATLFVGDVDGDKKLELLIAGLDGKLRCYGTNSTGKVEVGGFR